MSDVVRRLTSLEITRDERVRGNIVNLEKVMLAYKEEHGLAEPECPLVHAFAPGMYGRQITIPAGTLLVGKIHKHAHLNFLMQGKALVATEEGPQLLEAPMMLVSKAGTKRVFYVLEDVIWATVHATEETDLDKIEDELIAPSYVHLEVSHDPDVRQLLEVV